MLCRVQRELVAAEVVAHAFGEGRSQLALVKGPGDLPPLGRSQSGSTGPLRRSALPPEQGLSRERLGFIPDPGHSMLFGLQLLRIHALIADFDELQTLYMASTIDRGESDCIETRQTLETQWHTSAARKDRKQAPRGQSP